MSKNFRYSLPVFFGLLVLSLIGLAGGLLQAMERPVNLKPELQKQMVQLEPGAVPDENGNTVYQQTLSTHSWGQPVCAIMAKRVAFSVYLDDELLYAHVPDTYQHGGVVYWVSLPETQSPGQVLTVTSPSSRITVLAGDYSNLMLLFRNEKAPILVFSAIFLLLGVFIGLLSLGLKRAVVPQKPWTLRYLSGLVLLVGFWIFMDAAAFQYFTGYDSVMYVLTSYAFMALPFFLVQFFRSLLPENHRLLWLISRLNLLNLGLSGLLHALNVAPFYKTLAVTHILMIATLFSLLWDLFSRLNSEFGKEARLMLVGFAIMGCCCVVGFLDYYLWGKRLYLVFFSVGILFFIGSLLVVSIRYIYQEMVKASLLRHYQELANTDLMTRLGSRTSFEERIRQSPILEGPCACLIIDINNLKQVNDTMGHLAGDELIRDAATCLFTIFEPLGSCYRIGGDEFTVLLQNITEAQLRSALQDLDRRITRRNRIEPIRLSVAAGYAMGQDALIEQIFREADENMYQRKRQMKNARTQ